MGYSVEIVQLSRAEVDRLIALNTSNRRAKEAQIEILRASALDGMWRPSGSGITLSDGEPQVLLDGQNRLYGLREAWRQNPEKMSSLYGVGPEIVVFSGASPDTQGVLDRHSRRTTADSMSVFFGFTVASKVASVCNTLAIIVVNADGTINYLSGNLQGTIPTHELAAAYTVMSDEINMVVSICGVDLRVGMLAAIATYATARPDKARDFCERFRADNQLRRFEPVKKLRDHWVQTRGRKSGGKSAQMSDYRVAVSACLAHDEDRDIQLLRESDSWRHLSGEIHRFMDWGKA